MRYTELRDKHQNEWNEFPIMFAFNDKQFKEGMEKLGLSETDTDKIYSIGGGGYIRKDSSQALREMTERHERERKEAFQDDQYAYEAFVYELGNHEFCITYESEPTLDALGLTIDEVLEDCRLSEIFKQAKRDYLASCEY